MKKLKVYIAGPITRGDLPTNVNQATTAFVALALAGFAPFCPHWSVYSKPCRLIPVFIQEQRVECIGTANGNDVMSHSDWMGIDLEWVAVSDAVLRLPGESTGAAMEVAHATELGIPVFHSIVEVLAWKGWGNAT